MTCLPLAALVAAFVLAPNLAYAGCREDPREVKFANDSAVRLKSFNCTIGRDATARFRVEFNRYNVEAAAFLVGSSPNSPWKMVFGSTSVIKNSVYNEFTAMLNQYAIVKEHYSDSLIASGTGTDPNYVGRSDWDAGYGDKTEPIAVSNLEISLGAYPAVDEIRALNRAIIPDGINVFYGELSTVGDEGTLFAEPTKSALFWRYFNIGDARNFFSRLSQINADAKKVTSLDALANAITLRVNRDTTLATVLRFIDYIAKPNGLPKDFIILMGRFITDACGEPFWEFATYAPRVELGAMYIRNESGSTLSFTAIKGRRDVSSGIHSASEFGAGNAETIPLKIDLPPGASVTVPTQILFDGKLSEITSIDNRTSADVYRTLKSKGISSRPDVYAVPTRENYAFGDEIDAAGVIVNNEEIAFTNRSDNFLQLAEVPGLGSCPYLVYWDEDRKTWIEHGKVLDAANDRTRARTDVISKPGAVLRYRIEEREPEVATLSTPELLLQTRSGDTISLLPANVTKDSTGGVVLFWGENTEVDFEMPKGMTSADVVESRFVINGYYERYSSLRTAVSGSRGAMHWDAEQVKFNIKAALDASK